MIYHGTPLTPRAAFDAIMPGRAVCVSFWRPDNAEVAEAVCPAVLFRQWRIFRVDGRHEARRGMVSPRRLDAVLPVAGASIVRAGPVGCDTGCPWRAVPAQRRASQRMAFRQIEGCAALAHGRADLPAGQTVRAVRPGMPRLDRSPEARTGRVRGLSSAHGRGLCAVRQPLAGHPHDARRGGRAGLPLSQRRQHFARTERTPL